MARKKEKQPEPSSSSDDEQVAEPEAGAEQAPGGFQHELGDGADADPLVVPPEPVLAELGEEVLSQLPVGWLWARRTSPEPAQKWVKRWCVVPHTELGHHSESFELHFFAKEKATSGQPLLVLTMDGATLRRVEQQEAGDEEGAKAGKQKKKKRKSKKIKSGDDGFRFFIADGGDSDTTYELACG